ncbi:hypothetical protein ABPG75_013951 [Micractinium tetrahymenae]
MADLQGLTSTLHLAARHGNLASLNLVLGLPGAAAALNEPDEGGETALELALAGCHAGVAACLLAEPGIQLSMQQVAEQLGAARGMAAAGGGRVSGAAGRVAGQQAVAAAVAAASPARMQHNEAAASRTALGRFAAAVGQDVPRPLLQPATAAEPPTKKQKVTTGDGSSRLDPAAGRIAPAAARAAVEERPSAAASARLQPMPAPRQPAVAAAAPARRPAAAPAADAPARRPAAAPAAAAARSPAAAAARCAPAAPGAGWRAASPNVEYVIFTRPAAGQEPLQAQAVNELLPRHGEAKESWLPRVYGALAAALKAAVLPSSQRQTRSFRGKVLTQDDALKLLTAWCTTRFGYPHPQLSGGASFKCSMVEKWVNEVLHAAGLPELAGQANWTKAGLQREQYHCARGKAATLLRWAVMPSVIRELGGQPPEAPHTHRHLVQLGAAQAEAAPL